MTESIETHLINGDCSSHPESPAVQLVKLLFLFTGTSNWSENYFAFTAGVGLVVNQTGSAVKPGQQTLQSQAEKLFLRDWESEYASTLPVEDMDVCPRH